MSEKRVYAVDPEALRRFEICKTCEHLQIEEQENKPSKKICGACGCQLPPRLNHALKNGCPLNKWK